jgi:ATP-dependent helicase/nuclease subunit B
LDHAAFRARARELDRWCLRGPRPDAGLAGITRRIEKCGQQKYPPPPEALAGLKDWWSGIAAILTPLEAIYAQQEAPLPDLIAAHVAAAEALACDENENCVLWANADGEQAATLCAALEDDAQDLPPIEPGSYAALFRHLAMKAPVRAAFGRHPRLAILGPLEARLQRFDLTILGGLNEGSWPGTTSADPWFSRPMRATLGLEQPERSIGLAAHDFAVLAAGPCVLLTRSLKADGAPTVASRWLQRLEQLTRGLDLSGALTPVADYAALATRLMDVPLGPRLERPAPRPPVEVRPKKLSVTEIETWLRDPYAIYAKHILKLRPLDVLDEPVGPLERGNILHKALEEFVKAGGSSADQLIALADELFEDAGIPKAVLAVWRPRFIGAAQAFVDFERERRSAISKSHTEKRGTLELDGFTLTGIADRIDVLTDGRAAILDYKTGAVPSRKQIEQLLSPQLPLEAAMLAEDGFGIGNFTVAELIYFCLASEKQARKPRPIDDPMTRAKQAVEQLRRRIAWFNQRETPYRSRVKPYRADIAGDYDHLARVREWSPSGWGEEP